MLVKPKSLRNVTNEGSEVAAVAEKSMTGAKISREISVKVTRLLVRRFLLFAFFPEFSLLFLLNLISELE